MLPSQKSGYRSRNKFNYHSKPVIFPVQLNSQLEILSLQLSQHGRSSGVIFIETTAGSFVLKANNQAAQDFFYNQLALSLDLPAPMLQTIGCYCQQFQQLVYKIQKYCHTDQVLFARLKTKLDFPFYQVMQYVPSISMAHIGHKKFANNMLQEYKLYCVGICLGFDAVINNHDRWKLLWRGQGNVNNILVEILDISKNSIQRSRDRQDDTVKLGNFAFIDHQGHMIDYKKQLARVNTDKYMDIVSQFQLNMIQYLRKQSSSLPQQFDKLSKQIQFFTQYKLSQQDIIKICEGMIYCTKKFIMLYQSNQIQNLHSSIIKPVDTKIKEVNYWNQYWNNQFKQVNLNFCQMYYVKVSAIYVTYPQLINAIYQKVKKVIEANKNNKKRRISDLTNKSRKSSSQGNPDNLDAEDHIGQDKPKQQNNDDQEQNNQKGNNRKWREKLVQFKTQNYR